jgi:carbonic anhydrase
MHIYARIDSTFAQPTVMEIIEPAVDSKGNEISIDERFTSAFISTLVDITNVTPQPSGWWTYSGSEFSPPVLP